MHIRLRRSSFVPVVCNRSSNLLNLSLNRAYILCPHREARRHSSVSVCCNRSTVFVPMACCNCLNLNNCCDLRNSRFSSCFLRYMICRFRKRNVKTCRLRRVTCLRLLSFLRRLRIVPYHLSSLNAEMLSFSYIYLKMSSK